MREATTGTQGPYSINLDMRYAPLELIDVQALVDACKDPWYNQTLCGVNDCVVRLGVMQGEFHWHKHDKEIGRGLRSELWFSCSRERGSCRPAIKPRFRKGPTGSMEAGS